MVATVLLLQSYQSVKHVASQVRSAFGLVNKPTLHGLAVSLLWYVLAECGGARSRLYNHIDSALDSGGCIMVLLCLFFWWCEWAAVCSSCTVTLQCAVLFAFRGSAGPVSPVPVKLEVVMRMFRDVSACVTGVCSLFQDCAESPMATCTWLPGTGHQVPIVYTHTSSHTVIYSIATHKDPG